MKGVTLTFNSWQGGKKKEKQRAFNPLLGLGGGENTKKERAETTSLLTRGGGRISFFP